MSLPFRLVDRSTLTRIQVESLEAYMKVLSRRMSLKEAAGQRESGGVTVGSYYRTVQQARWKIRASLLTLIMALWLGLVKVEDLRRLLDLTGKGVPDLAEDEENQLVTVLDVLINKIVM